MDSDEEFFCQAVASCKEQGLAVKFSRDKKSEFKHDDSQSQGTSSQTEAKKDDNQMLCTLSNLPATDTDKDVLSTIPEKDLSDSDSERVYIVIVTETDSELPGQSHNTDIANSQSASTSPIIFQSTNKVVTSKPETSTGMGSEIHNSVSSLRTLSDEEILFYEVQENGELMPVLPNHTSRICDDENVQELSITTNTLEKQLIVHGQLDEPNQSLIFKGDETIRSNSVSPSIVEKFVEEMRPSTSSGTGNDLDYEPEMATSCSSEEDNNSALPEDSRKKTKKRKGLAEPEKWKAVENKKLRESGESYIGWKRNLDKCNTNNVPRPARQLKETCDSEFCRRSKQRHCDEFTPESRQRIFNTFWSLSWKEKKIFVINTTERYKTETTTDQESRRTASLQYYLKQGDDKMQVCKKMYLNTLDIGEWSVRNWINKSSDGMLLAPSAEEIEKKKRGENKKNAREHLVQYIDSLPKLPSHYCRKDTSKLYLEPVKGGMLEVYKAYCEDCLKKGVETLSRTMFDKVIKEKNIAFQPPKKDMCDTCVSYFMQQISDSEYTAHQIRKHLARDEKKQDLKDAEEGKCILIEQDVQAVKICPYLRASSAYYRRKLINHNFTIMEYPSKKVRCYWFSEVNGDTQASVFVSCLLDYLEDKFRSSEDQDKKPIIIWSDGCTYQNRNAVLANALSNFAALNDIVIFHKYLEPGHTQMEVDSVHANIEKNIQKYEAIYVPSQYADISKKSRKNPPYEVKILTYDFFKKYDDPKVMRFDSIRPGKKKGDSVVTDLKAIKYEPNGKLYYKIDFSDEAYLMLPQRPKVSVNFPTTTYSPLYEGPLKLTSAKFSDLQALKHVIPDDYHSFYDSLPHN